MRQIILDTETTGLSAAEGHRVIEIGCIEMKDRRPTGKTFHYYLNPEREIDAGAQKVHGLSAEFLKDKPLFSTIASAFIEFIQDAELIIHNADFDVGFLNSELTLTGHPKRIADLATVIDTLPMARSLHPGQKNSLDALCKRYGVDNKHRSYHGALLDAELLAHVYLAMTTGQDSLFDSETTQTSTAETTTTFSQPFSRSSQALPVIMASESESAAHASYLDFLNKQSQGKCLWKEGIDERA